MEFADALLIEATEKLIELTVRPEWAFQLPARCPPVLWFGNAASVKEKVLTLGANPSRREFLSDSALIAREKIRQPDGQSLLTYREPPRNRFRLLLRDEKLERILVSRELRQEIINSYNSYFGGNEYAWFGKNREDSYNVEGFLRGFGASYFNGDSVSQQAIHIDLFPFATVDDFGAIRKTVADALFADGWAQRIVSRLIGAIAPTTLVIFGRTNCDYFAEYIDRSIDIKWAACELGKFFIGRSPKLRVPVVCLTTNLGNPKGFNKATIREFGKFVQEAAQ